MVPERLLAYDKRKWNGIRCIPATHGWILPSHVHLQMLEEVMVLIAGEGHHHPHCATQGGVDQRIAAARNQGCFGQTDYGLANVSDCDALSLLTSPTGNYR